MAKICPYCGTSLPALVDAYCPECRGCLDELPAPAITSGDTATNPADKRRIIGLILAVAGFLGVFSAVLSGSRGHGADAVYTGIVGLVLTIAGLYMHGALGR